jgi:transcriptional regulator with XRE-family HTH domain
MAGRQNWNNLLNKMPAERRARIERGVRDDLGEMLLCEIRRLTGLTQQQVADSMGIKQPTLSALESQEDMQVSTLYRIVRALGGELEVVAKLPTGRIAISQFKDVQPARSSANRQEVYGLYSELARWFGSRNALHFGQAEPTIQDDMDSGGRSWLSL